MFAFIRKLFAKQTPHMDKYLIVGLGNIGPEYAGTRHNAGFRIADAFAAAQGATWDDRRYGFVAKTSLRGRPVVLLKPSTYMNLSGNAVRYWMQQEHIDLPHVLVCVDDIALPFGQLRMKPSGSDAGHNGLKHIAQTLGTQAYARLRFGIGSDYARGQQIDYVLGTFPPEQEARMADLTAITTQAIKTFCTRGIQAAMNDCNRQPASAEV